LAKKNQGKTSLNALKALSLIFKTIIFGFEILLLYIWIIFALNTIIRSEQHELLSDVTDDVVGDHFQDIEMHGFAKGSALSNHHDISFFD
jgi:hypothetical protein